MDKDQNVSNSELRRCTRKRNLIKIDESSSKGKIMRSIPRVMRARAIFHSVTQNTQCIPFWQALKCWGAILGFVQLADSLLYLQGLKNIRRVCSGLNVFAASFILQPLGIVSFYLGHLFCVSLTGFPHSVLSAKLLQYWCKLHGTALYIILYEEMSCQKPEMLYNDSC
jgi:hypothetical protein